MKEEDLDEAYLNKTISRSFYDHMKKATDSPFGPTANTDPATFYDLTNTLVQPETTPERAREALLAAAADGKLSSEDSKKLYSMHLIPGEEGPQSLKDVLGPKAQGDFETIKNLADAQKKQLDDKKNAWHSAFKFMDHTLDNDQQAVTQARQKLYDRMAKSNSKDPMAEAPVILFEDFAKQNPQVKTFPKEGKVLMLGGKKWRYFPDKMPEEVK